MPKPKPNKIPEEIRRGLEAFGHLKSIFTTGAQDDYALSDIDYDDPDSGGPVPRSDWPRGLAEYLDGQDWKLQAKEHNLIVDALEALWKTPRTWGVFIDERGRHIDLNPIDDPSVKDG